MTHDREIVAAALRWHTAHVNRLEISSEQRQYQATQKKRTGFGGSDFAIGKRLTAAKRPELTALRQLAKACAQARNMQACVTDVDVVEVVGLRLCTTDKATGKQNDSAQEKA